MRRALLLLVPALLAAAEGDIVTVVSSQPTRTLPLVDVDFRTVASARLYVSENGGASWSLAQELTVDPAATVAPRFSFTAPRDGSYGFLSAVTYRDQQREPEPRASQPPAVLIVFDTTTPTITRFAARAESVVSGNANLRLAWAASDAGLGEDPATIEISGDGGATFAPLLKVPAQGTIVSSVAVPAGVTRLQARLSVVDRAGNQALGPVEIVDLPAPVAADAALVGALASLPSASAPAPAAPPLVPAPQTPAVQTRPDIVVPPASPTAAAPAPAPAAADDEIVRGGGLDQEYRSRRGPEDKPGAWQDRTRPRSDGGGKVADVEQPAPVPAAPEVAKPVEPPAPTLPAGIPPAGMLSPQQAQSVLEAARAAAARNDLPAALLLYRRARSGSLADAALVEELRLLRAHNRAGEGLGVVAGLPAELRTDAVRIEHGRLLLASNRAREAMEVFAEVRRTAPQAQEALLLIGDSLHAQGQKDQARKVWTAVEKAGGPQAKPAHDRLAAGR